MNNELRTFLTLKYPSAGIAVEYQFEKVTSTVFLDFVLESGIKDGYFFHNDYRSYVTKHDYFHDEKCLVVCFDKSRVDYRFLEGNDPIIIFPDFSIDHYNLLLPFLSPAKLV